MDLLNLSNLDIMNIQVECVLYIYFRWYLCQRHGGLLSVQVLHNVMFVYYSCLKKLCQKMIYYIHIRCWFTVIMSPIVLSYVSHCSRVRCWLIVMLLWESCQMFVYQIHVRYSFAVFISYCMLGKCIHVRCWIYSYLCQMKDFFHVICWFTKFLSDVCLLYSCLREFCQLLVYYIHIKYCFAVFM